MNDYELLAILNQAEQDAAIYNGEYSQDNEKYLKEYLGDPYGDEIEGQSSAVSTDIADVVESDMPALARIFMGSGDIITFEANTDNEAEVKEAEEKTKYINWLIRNQPDSFKMLHDWLKDAEIQKSGVVKYFMDESKDVEERKYEGIDLEELVQIEESLKGAEVDKIKVDISEVNELPGDKYDVSFRLTRVKKQVKIINIPQESFLVSKNAKSLMDAEFVGDRVRKTRGKLLAEGYDREFINKLPTVDSGERKRTTLKSIRHDDEGGADYESEINDWASEYVEICDLCVQIDYDGDGIAERRHIIKSGNVIIENEPFNHVHYALLSAVLMPHKAIGRSRAEIVSPKQRQKTAILRGILNNIYSVNNPRNVVHDDVDLDDMLEMRINGVVRMDEDTNVLPRDAVFPLIVPYIGDQALQVIQYVDSARAQSTGVNLANQGLDADAIAKETATRFEGIEEKGAEKLELIARNYAETGFRKLFEGIAWLVSRYQDSEQEVRVLGKQLTVNPSRWKYDHQVSTNVGLGAGNNEKLVGSLQGLLAIQQQLKAQQSTLTDDQDIYNTLKRIVDGLGLPRVDEFFNNPEEPESTLKAENEILNQTVLALQEQMQQMQNPLVEPEIIKLKGKLADAQSKGQLELAKMQEGARQFDRKMGLEEDKLDKNVAVELTKIETSSGQDVPGSVV